MYAYPYCVISKIFYKKNPYFGCNVLLNEMFESDILSGPDPVPDPEPQVQAPARPHCPAAGQMQGIPRQKVGYDGCPRRPRNPLCQSRGS